MPDDSALAPEDVNEILKSQSSRRKACYPCHQRKVGCDGGRPCRRCSNRRHPDLCGYEPGPSRRRKRTAEEVGAIELNRATRMTSHGRGSTSAASSEGPSLNVPTLVPNAQGTSREWEQAAETRLRGPNKPGSRSEENLSTSSVPSFILDKVSSVNPERSGTSSSELRNLILPALGLQGNGNNPRTQTIQHASYVQRVLELRSRGSEIARSVNPKYQVHVPIA